MSTINLSTSAFFESASRQIGTLRKQANKLQEQVGSGEALSKSSDNPVAAARLRAISREERLADINQASSDRAVVSLRLTEDGLSSIADVISRAKELATQAANQATSDSIRKSIGAEIATMSETLLSIANSRNSQGHALFGGETLGDAYQDVNGTITYLGTASSKEVGLGEGQSVVPALTGPEVLSFNDSNGATDLFKVLGTLAAALQSNVGDPIAASRDALGSLDAGLEKVTTQQTVIGARMTWVELMDERRQQSGDLLASEKADVGGADLATTITKLQETLTVLEASQASFVKLANLSLFNLIN